MRALFLARVGEARRAFELREVPDPVMSEDEILLETEFSGLNFADVMSRMGIYPDAPPIPFIPGYEVVGRIRALGERVSRLRPELKSGQRVVALTRFGGYASSVCAKAIAVMPLAEEADGAEATALATQGVTAWLAAEECVRLHSGERVLIHAAAGGVGMMLVQLAQRRGCEIFATAGSTEKLQLLREEFGVQHAIGYRSVNFREEIRRITGKRAPIDVVFDSIGGSVFRSSLQLLAPGGRLVYFGVAEMAQRSPLGGLRAAWSALRFGFIHPLTLLQESQALIGLNVLRIADHHPEKLAQGFSELQKLVAAGELHSHVGATFPVREVASAHELLESRQSVGKIVLRW
jgi:NADPH:quinone reductase-like Zn-dependent oxidoreductase